MARGQKAVVDKGYQDEITDVTNPAVNTTPQSKQVQFTGNNHIKPTAIAAASKSYTFAPKLGN